MHLPSLTVAVSIVSSCAHPRADAQPSGALAARTSDTAILNGIAFMCIAVLAFVCLNASGKFLTGHGLSTTQIVWSRYVGGMMLMLFLFAPKHGWGLLKTTQPKIQIARSLLLVASSLLYFRGLSYIALPTAAAISFTSPLFITALSLPLLAERVGPRRWVAVMVGFVGAMIVIRPGMSSTHWAVAYIVGSTTCSVLYQVLTRRVAGQDDVTTSATYPTVFGTVVVSLFVLMDWSFPQNTLDWAIFVSLGVFGGGGHYFLTKAYASGPAAVISPFNYLQLVGAIVAGYLIFGDFPDELTLLGAGIIVMAGLYIAHREGVHRRRRVAGK
ncbi:MAG: DMT family transporter [Chromatiales bacterium]|nr:DMT family transporter [Chromatiales bacterium]